MALVVVILYHAESEFTQNMLSHISVSKIFRTPSKQLELHRGKDKWIALVKSQKGIDELARVKSLSKVMFYRRDCDIYGYDLSALVSQTEIEMIESCLTLYEYITSSAGGGYMPHKWEPFFRLTNVRVALKKISDFLKGERDEFFPPLHQVFTIFDMVPFDEIRAIIIGQDPYHNEGQAMGIAFATAPGNGAPPSLKNIYKEVIATGWKVAKPASGNLLPWVKQGVFLINTALTVHKHQPGSHSRIWTDKFTPLLFEWINSNCKRPLVVIMWGNHAL